MKLVLISTQPNWCDKIIEGKKTIEVRKTKPNLQTPFKCYIYETKGREKIQWIDDWLNTIYEKVGGKVIGEFICDKIYDIKPHDDGYGVTQYSCGWKYKQYDMCLSFEELKSYLGDKNGFGWHISDLKIYDKPKELSEFYSVGYKECEFRNEFHICEKYKDKLHSCKYGLCDNKRIKKPPQSWCYVEDLGETK